MAQTKVSIVTPSYNQARFLPETLQSVRQQSYPTIEHIIVDGGSTDGTPALLRATPGLQWLSEPDRGQVHALNKGFALASGEVLGWLCADDTFYPDTISTAVAVMQTTGAEFVYGIGVRVDENHCFQGVARTTAFDPRSLLCCDNWIAQPTVFFTRGLLAKVGPLREEFDNAFDYELWLRMARLTKPVFVPMLRAHQRIHATAKTTARPEVSQRDHAQIRREYWSATGLSDFWLRPACFPLLHYYFRAKRRLAWWSLIRREQLQFPTHLMLGYLPPPYFGPSVTYQALFRSQFIRKFDCRFVNLGVVESVSELERLSARKLWRLGRILWQELRLLATTRFASASCPVSVNRNAFIKDALLLGLAQLFRVPTLLYAHGNNLPDFYDRSPPWLRGLISRTCQRAAGAIVLGERLRFNFQRWLPDERIFVVPTGIEPHGFSVSRRAPRSDRVTVLFLGNLVRDKGVFDLLAAAVRIAEQRPQVHFVFAGVWMRREDQLEAEELVARARLQARVEFLGVVAGDAKRQALDSADILAFPTAYYYETMGLVLLEAMEAGIPVVTTRRASIPEIVQDGINGLLVAERNPADLAEKILRLVDSPALRQAMGQANQVRFREFYTHEHYGQRMIQAYEQLQANAGQSGRLGITVQKQVVLARTDGPAA